MLKKKREGFTLIEMALVVGIGVTLSYVAMIGVVQLERNYLKNEAIKIQTLIRYGQKESILQGKEHVIRINKKGVTLEGGSEILKEVKIKKKYGIKTNITREEIKFQKRGTTGSAGSIVIISDNFEVEVTVNIGSGRVKVYRVRERGMGNE